MRSDALHLLGALGIGAALLAAGCARTTLETSVAQTSGSLDVTSELDFWDGLAMQHAVTNRDALHAVLLTFNALPDVDADHEVSEEDAAQQPPDADADADAAAETDENAAAFESELALAQQRGWIPADAHLPPNETAQVGWIATAMCIEARIEGGVNMHLFGPIPRYALRELQYKGIMAVKSENQAVSGLELMAMLGRIADWRSGLASTPRQDF